MVNNYKLLLTKLRIKKTINNVLTSNKCNKQKDLSNERSFCLLQVYYRLC